MSSYENILIVDYVLDVYYETMYTLTFTFVRLQVQAF